MPADHAIVKLDFSNAFNSLHRDVMLTAVAESVPEIYKLCHLSYDSSSTLSFNNHTISSLEGVQQSDPLGPILFCLSIHPLLLSCESKFKIAYMDNITLGGPSAVVAADVALIRSQGTTQGLFLYDKKCEVKSVNNHINEISLQQFIQYTPSSSTLLRAPLSHCAAMDDCLSKRCIDLERAISRLELIMARDAIVLLRASYNAPSLQHTIRASPCCGHISLSDYDNLLRSALSKICNITLSENQWLQASLPIRSGVLGIRRITSLASSAYLASAVGTRDLQNQILNLNAQLPDNDVENYIYSWQTTYNKPIPSETSAAK